MNDQADPAQRPSSRIVGENMSTMGRRTTISPLNIAATAAGDEDPEQSQLILEALQVFSSKFSRLPSSLSTSSRTTQHLPFAELAHSIVQAAEGLCHLLRKGRVRCEGDQIDAELTALWRECSPAPASASALSNPIHLSSVDILSNIQQPDATIVSSLLMTTYLGQSTARID